MTDPHSLERFVHAQDPVWTQVTDELANCRKRSHWMWFVFPQVDGLGRSDMAHKYAIRSLDEARAYLAHPVLGQRLRDATQAVVRCTSPSAEDIFGGTDAMKLRSSMTLFARAAPHEAVFTEVLTKYFDGRSDENTLTLLVGTT